MSMQVASKLSVDMIATYRRRHLAYLMADQGALVGNPDSTSHLPKQHLARYEVTFNPTKQNTIVGSPAFCLKI